MDKSDAEAKTIISRSLDDNSHTIVQGCQTAEEMWIALKAIHESKTETDALIAIQDFHSLVWEEGVNVATFFINLKYKINRVKGLGSTLDKNTVIGKVLQCLPPHFDSFKTSWRMCSTSKSTIDDLQIQLLATEMDLKLTGKITVGEAFYGSRKQEKSWSSSNKKDPKGKKIKGNCFHCDKSGHIKANCFKWKRQQHEKNQEQSSPINKKGFVVTALGAETCHTTGLWVSDSGAYAHIFSRKKLCIKYHQPTHLN